ncbi:MAG: AMP-binding protein [Candidatus Bathyarchaeota archaeon]|nr:MAG: AMP-binding protein [Candidatus Bathyarchaeota archaeon]
MTKEVDYSDKPWQKSYFIGPFKLAKTNEPYPKIPVSDFLDTAAANYPNQIACVYLGEEVTYRELKLKVDKLAAALTDLGVRKGDRVATILPNCPQFIISDYAIMKVGAIHVPISILHKAPDLLYELGESAAKTIICSYRRLDRVISIKDKTSLRNIIFTLVPIFPDYSLPEIGETSGALRLEELLEKYPPDPPEVEINPTTDLALLPFTGGTTGVPKGTMLTHFNITTNVIQGLQWMMKPLAGGIKGKSSVVICVPAFHQFGHYGVHASISWGLRMFLVDPRDIDSIVNIINERRPFMVMGVPTHYMLLLTKNLRRMQIFCYSGAAALPQEVAEKIEKKIGVPMGEGYGLTEATAATHLNLSAFSKVTGFMTNVKRSIGVPIPDTDVTIIDPETGDEVPAGKTGELHIRGPQVMKGYWPTPGKGLKDGWLATGDIARMDEDGYFFIVDRIKDMINVSGMKVYSRLIDDILYEHPAVNAAGAIGLPDPERPGSERIKVFIALKGEFDGKVTPKDIIEYCRKKLPPYAVPKFVEFRDKLPLTLAMKIFKRKLKEEELEKIKAAT